MSRVFPAKLRELIPGAKKRRKCYTKFANQRFVKEISTNNDKLLASFKVSFQNDVLPLGYRLDIDEKLNLLLCPVSQYLVAFQYLHFFNTPRKIFV